MKIVVKTKVGFSLAQILPEEIGTISELENVTIVETGTANSLIKRSKSILASTRRSLLRGSQRIKMLSAHLIKAGLKIYGHRLHCARQRSKLRVFINAII